MPSSLTAPAQARRSPHSRPRAVEDWLEDLRWHQQMFQPSRWRWAEDDVLRAALRLTRGRLLFETTGHLPVIERGQQELWAYLEGLRRRIAGLIEEATSALGSQARAGLEAAGLTQVEIDMCRWYEALKTVPVADDRQVRRVLGGLPLPNPLIEIWELLQLQAMYQATMDVLEDTFCDLVEELAQRRSYVVIAPMTTSRTVFQLDWRVADQRKVRGLPGDCRRTPRQVPA